MTAVVPVLFIAIITMFSIIAVVVVLARWVYRDAKDKGLPAGMWTAIAVLVPNFIGFIIYLVYRSDKKPEMLCKNCGRNIEMNVSFCPYCGYQSPPVAAAITSSRIPKKILAILFVVSGFFLVGAICVMAIAGFGAFDATVSNSVTHIIDEKASSSYAIPPVPSTPPSIAIGSSRAESVVYYGENTYESKSSNAYTFSFDSMEGLHSVKLQIPDIESGTRQLRYTFSYFYQSERASVFAMINDVELEFESTQITNSNGTRYEEGYFDLRGYAGESVTLYISSPYITNGYFDVVLSD